MIVEIRAKRALGDQPERNVIDGAILIDGIVISGPCGLTIPEPKFKEFIDRISPDTINEIEYIPTMPIELDTF